MMLPLSLHSISINNKSSSSKLFAQSPEPSSHIGVLGMISTGEKLAVRQIQPTAFCDEERPSNQQVRLPASGDIDTNSPSSDGSKAATRLVEAPSSLFFQYLEVAAIASATSWSSSLPRWLTTPIKANIYSLANCISQCGVCTYIAEIHTPRM